MDYGPGALQKLKIIGKNNERYLVAYRIGQSDWAYGGMTFEEARKLLKKPGWQQQTEKRPASSLGSMCARLEVARYDHECRGASLQLIQNIARRQC